MSTLKQDKEPTSGNSVRATVTGVDSNGQLFRDNVGVVCLKTRKCIYESKVRPSPDGELMIDLPNGKEAWRSNAKVRSVSSVGGQRGTFRVTIELDRAHSLVIEGALEAPAAAEPADKSPATPPVATKPAGTPSAPPVAHDTKEPDSNPAELSARPFAAPSPADGSTDNPVKPACASTPTPLPKMMVADIVRSVLAPELAQMKRELQGAVASQVEEAAENAQVEWASTKLQKMVTEAVRSALASNSEQRRREVATLVSDEIEAAVRGPIAARIDATLEKTLEPKIKQHFQTQHAVDELQKTVVEAVHQLLEAEYEQRERQVQAVVSSEIETAVRGPITAQMGDMLKNALDEQRAEYLRTPPPITEETVRKLVAGVAEHPQFQKSMDALAANLSDRWTEVARGATATAQQDIASRVADSERLANQVILDIHEKLNSFSVEMNRIFGSREAGSDPSSPRGPRGADLQEREKHFHEVLQTAGSQFEREMKAALKKIFGKS